MKAIRIVSLIAGIGLAAFVMASTASAASCSKTSSVWSTTLICLDGLDIVARLRGISVPKSLEVFNFAAAAGVGLGLDSSGNPVAGCLAQDNTADGSPVIDSSGCEPCVKMRLVANW